MPSTAAPITMRSSVTFTVTPVPFEPFAALSLIDPAALGKGRVDLEVGAFTGSSCCGPRVVRARVVKGMVTALTVDPCEDGNTPPGPALAALVQAALKKARRRGAKPLTGPMPVTQFLAEAAAISVDTIVCVRICFFEHCITCCSTVSGDIACGHISIDTTTID